MGVTHQIELFSDTIDTNATTAGDTIELESGYVIQNIILTSEVSDRTDGTYTVTVQHSPDDIHWFNLDATAAQSSNGMVIKEVTATCFKYIRASILSALVVDGADVTVTFWFN